MSFPYLEEMRHGFRRALERGLELHEVTLVVDGETLLLLFAGHDLADALLPALAPIVAASDATPILTVELWDSASADIHLPRRRGRGPTEVGWEP